MPATSPPSKPFPRAAGGARSRSPAPPENPARLMQIVGANGGNGVSKAIPRHIVDEIAGANLPLPNSPAAGRYRRRSAAPGVSTDPAPRPETTGTNREQRA